MYLTSKDTAQLLGISTRQLARYVALDAIPYVPMRLPGSERRQIRFSKADLIGWMDAQKRAA